MSDSATSATSADDLGGGKSKKPSQVEKKNFFGRIMVFIRQVIAELKKVVTPTRSELLNYTLVVVVFVLLMMAFVLVLDFIIGKGVFAIFG